MATSIDDLVASLSSNHIGQEAMDLAALQAQLAQTLRYSAPSALPHSLPQRSNTPVLRTPRASFCEGQWEDIEQTRAWNQSSRDETDGMDEDERMVEDLLFPSSPASSNSTTSRYSASQVSPVSPLHHRGPNTSSSYAHTQFDSNTSLFATTDPFYLAQLQAAQTPSSPSSFFSQYGKPSQQSPFMMSHHPQNRSYAHPHFTGASEAEPHVFFAAPQPQVAFT